MSHHFDIPDISQISRLQRHSEYEITYCTLKLLHILYKMEIGHIFTVDKSDKFLEIYS